MRGFWGWVGGLVDFCMGCVMVEIGIGMICFGSGGFRDCSGLGKDGLLLMGLGFKI